MKTKHLTEDQISSISSIGGSKYQTVDAIGEQWAQAIREHLDPEVHKQVLDAGCGAGFLSIVLARMGFHVTALDQSRTALEQARQHARQFQVEDRITFCHSDTVETDMPAGFFDAVVCRHTSALFLMPYAVYQEWYRLLKVGGILLNYDANWLSPLWNEENARAFMEDEKVLREQVADYTDMYHDRYVLYKLSQYPLAYEQRPEWDLRVCREVGYREVNSCFLPEGGFLPPVLAQRFRSIPSFLVKAIR